RDRRGHGLRSGGGPVRTGGAGARPAARRRHRRLQIRPEGAGAGLRPRRCRRAVRQPHAARRSRRGAGDRTGIAADLRRRPRSVSPALSIWHRSSYFMPIGDVRMLQEIPRTTAFPDIAQVTAQEAEAMARAVIRLFEKWQVSDTDAREILGGLAARTYARWKAGEPGRIDRDLGTRLSL